MENNQENLSETKNDINIVSKLSEKLDFLLQEYEKTLKENIELKDVISKFQIDNQELSSEIKALESESNSKDSELENMIGKIEKLLEQ